MLKATISLIFLTTVAYGQLVPLSQNDKNEFVSSHNQWRTIQGATLPKVKWNDGLAKLAETSAKTCVFEHTVKDKRKNVANFDYIGENIFVGTAKPTGKSVVDSWGGEIKDYDLKSNTCKPGAMCGHYTQVTWSKSTDIGCAIVQCNIIKGVEKFGKAYIAFCEYGPGGNVNGQPPYTLGKTRSTDLNPESESHPGILPEEPQTQPALTTTTRRPTTTRHGRQTTTSTCQDASIICKNKFPLGLCDKPNAFARYCLKTCGKC